MSPEGLPPVTCLCPTYGRFERLRDALACFLLQDYPGTKRLLILNDAPHPLRLGPAATGVRLINVRPRFPTLGQKRQALLEMAEAPLVAHWDDDDLYLPWHLSACARRLTERPGARCAKPRTALLGLGPRDRVRIRGVRRNVFEGQMVFERERALRLGGYPPLVSGQARALLNAFERAGELHSWEPPPERISYVYRWADGAKHISTGGNTRDGHERFGRRNADFGLGPGGRPRGLIPRRDALAWAARRLAPIRTLISGQATHHTSPRA